MPKSWNTFFTPKGLRFLEESIDLALAEDGPERTSEGIFPEKSQLHAVIRAKEDTLVVGLPLIDLVFERMHEERSVRLLVEEGSFVRCGIHVAEIDARAIALLKAERVILNYICHLSGIANLTKRYVDALTGTGVKLLDTRKTSPCLRWPEKYAIQMGGGWNHRIDLTEMLMLKDNHIDALGSITKAVNALRSRYNPCPPIEVECRKKDDVEEAVACRVERIMLDNMDSDLLKICLPLVPDEIEVEISGGVRLDTIRLLATLSPRKPNFISVGRLTHSACAADLSMTISTKEGTLS